MQHFEDQKKERTTPGTVPLIWPTKTAGSYKECFPQVYCHTICTDQLLTIRIHTDLLVWH